MCLRWRSVGVADQRGIYVGRRNRSSSVLFVYPGTTWTATSNAAWIAITDQSSPDGNGTVTYTVAPNPGVTARTGSLAVASQTVTITQDGAAADDDDDGVP